MLSDVPSSYETVFGSQELTPEQEHLCESLGYPQEPGSHIDQFVSANPSDFFHLSTELAQWELSKLWDEMVAKVEAEGRTGFAAAMLNPGGCCLLVNLYGDPTQWKHPFLDIAIGKVRIAHEWQMDTRTVQEEYPHLLRSVDTVHAGGIWYQHVSAAVSGFSSVDDEAFSRRWIKAVVNEAKKRNKRWRQAHPKLDFFDEDEPEATPQTAN